MKETAKAPGQGLQSKVKYALLDNYTDDGYPKDHPGFIRFARRVEREYNAKLSDFRNIIFPPAAKASK